MADMLRAGGADAFLAEVLPNQWLCWGLATMIAANLGYWVTGAVFEMVLRAVPPSMLLHQDGRDRREQLAEIHARIPLWTQVKGSAWVMLGPMAAVNAAVSAALMGHVIGQPTAMYPTVAEFLSHLALMAFINDFFLYVGHRVQHENRWLWENCHSKHHAVLTPSPFSTVYIDDLDATLQGGLPMILAGLVVQMHPVTWWVFVALRVSENVINHSGLDSTLVDVLTLRVLPGRAGISHHDSHHRFSNYARNAKNYAEGFWVWDYLFGTLRPQLRSAHKNA